METVKNNLLHQIKKLNLDININKAVINAAENLILLFEYKNLPDEIKSSCEEGIAFIWDSKNKRIPFLEIYNSGEICLNINNKFYVFTFNDLNLIISIFKANNKCM